MESSGQEVDESSRRYAIGMLAAIDWLCKAFGFEKKMAGRRTPRSCAMTQDCGGRDYTTRDLEGHVWTFGTYDPWVS